jgi:hypothetical protein
MTPLVHEKVLKRVARILQMLNNKMMNSGLLQDEQNE